MPLSLEEKVRLLSMVDVFEALSEEELRRGRDKDRHPLHPRATSAASEQVVSDELQ